MSDNQAMSNPPTQPTQPPAPGYGPPPRRQGSPNRSNLLILLVIGAAVVCLSCSIIGLAGLAGYNDGVHEINRRATVTTQAEVIHQYNLALTDVAADNPALAALRLEHIVITVGADSVDAVLLLTQVRAATATPTPSPTTAPSATPEATPTPSLEPTAGLPPLDPAALFTEAQSSSVLRDWARAIELLDILIAVDPGYQSVEVQRLLQQALAELSRRYLNEASTERLAEGILLAERAAALGPIGDLAYEAYVAGRYLDGLTADGMECLLSVREWESVYNEAPQYRDVEGRLANSYTRCGDAYTFQTEYCPAEQYYTWSLGLVYDVNVAASRDEARTLCAQATPTPTPTLDPLAVPTADPAATAPPG